MKNIRSKERFIFLFVSCCCLFFSAHAQTTVFPPDGFAIGDTVDLGRYPVRYMKDPENRQQKDLAHLKGKWLILDFWATYCQACINAMPLLNQLQEKFRDQLNIIVVTSENEEKVGSLLRRSEFTKNNKLPFLVEDTVYSKLFPHRIIPHEIWIDPEGVVRAITSGEDVNADNISRMLAGSRSQMLLKRDVVGWRGDQGYIEAAADGKTLYRSVLRKYEPGVPTTGYYKWDSLQHSTLRHVSFYNYTPLQMFYSLFMRCREHAVGNLNPYRFVIDIRDRDTRQRYIDEGAKIPFAPRNFPYLKWNSKFDYNNDNCYIYHLTLPGFVDDSVSFFNDVMNDLNRYFPIRARIEKRPVSSLVIVCRDVPAALQKLAEADFKNRPKIDGEAITLKKRGISDFIRVMKYFRAPPIIDETHIPDSVKLNIQINFSSSANLNRRKGLVVNMYPFDEAVFRSELNKYGLDVVKETRLVEMIVITDQ